jgi:hypothetical protein
MWLHPTESTNLALYVGCDSHCPRLENVKFVKLYKWNGSGIGGSPCDAPKSADKQGRPSGNHLYLLGWSWLVFFLRTHVGTCNSRRGLSEVSDPEVQGFGASHSLTAEIPPWRFSWAAEALECGYPLAHTWAISCMLQSQAPCAPE